MGEVKTMPVAKEVAFTVDTLRAALKKSVEDAVAAKNYRVLEPLDRVARAIDTVEKKLQPKAKRAKKEK